MAALKKSCQAVVLVSVFIGIMCVIFSVNIANWVPPITNEPDLYSFYHPKIPTHGSVSPNYLPEQGKVAIVLRGVPFRNPKFTLEVKGRSKGKGSNVGNKLGCNKQQRVPQLSSINSLVEMVIKPLEDNNNLVDVVLASSVPNCTLMSRLVSILGSERILAADSFSSSGQLASIKFASDTFLNSITAPPPPSSSSSSSSVSTRRINDVSEYDLVIFARMDIHWNTPINYWETNFTRLNFFSRCTQPGHSPIPWPCVHDIIQTMPGKFFREWSSAALKCFSLCPSSQSNSINLACPISNGHNCYQPLSKLLGPNNVGLVTNSMKDEEVNQIAILTSNYKLPAI
jgi:hypothetical protein